MQRRSLTLIAGAAVASLAAASSGAAAAAVDCTKPVAPCTACHSPQLTQPYAACVAQPWAAPAAAKATKNPLAPPTPKALADAKANYGVMCEGCHGETGDGAGRIAVKFSIPAADLTAPGVQRQSDGELYWKIAHGFGAMPMWADALTDNDRWQLILLIRSFAKKP